MTPARRRPAAARATLVAALSLAACRTSQTWVGVGEPIKVQSPAPHDCVDVGGAGGGDDLIRGICFGSPAGELRPVAVSLDATVSCLRVSELHGRHLAFAGADDQPDRDLVEVEPAGGAAAFAIRSCAVHVTHRDGGTAPAIELGTGRIAVEAFRAPCWRICPARRGDLIVELGGTETPVAYQPPAQPACAVLGPTTIDTADAGDQTPPPVGAASPSADAGS